MEVKCPEEGAFFSNFHKGAIWASGNLAISLLFGSSYYGMKSNTDYHPRSHSVAESHRKSIICLIFPFHEYEK